MTRTKTIKITTCDDCPNFDNSYYDYAQRCALLDRYIPQTEKHEHLIPEDCPLPDAKTDE